MRKAMYILTGICGFVLLFAVSGLVAYYMFPGEESAKEVDNIYSGDDAMALLNLTGEETEVTPDLTGGNLTIVTPSLDKSKTVVRRGTLEDVVPSAAPSETPTFSFEEETLVIEEAQKENKKTAERQKEEEKKPEPQTVIQEPVQPQAPEPHTPQPEPQPETPQPQPEPEPQQPEMPQLAPNIQTSDTGL